MIERLLTDYGILLRDDRVSAAFIRSRVTTLRLDVPRELPLEAVDRVLRTTTPELTAVQPAPERPADPFFLDRRLALLPLFCERDEVQAAGYQPWVGRLTLNVSNACNLWCSYCYADKGQYHAPRSFMSPEAAIQLTRRVLDIYSEVNMVQFFGGEPLMNLPAIEAVCREFAAAVDAGRIDRMPRFAATTNGTLSSKDVLDVLSRWHVSLTVSHDGPRELHDASRPMGAGGRGGSSFDRIEQSTRRFAERDIDYDIECTYNRRHYDSGTTVVDLMDYFHQLTGQDAFHISPVFVPRPGRDEIDARSQLVFRGESLQQLRPTYLSPEEVIPLYRAAACRTIESLLAGRGPKLSFAVQMIQNLAARKASGAYCPAFFDQLSLTVDGAAYPCFMFIGDPRFRMGNLLTDELPMPGAQRVLARYFREFGSSPLGTDAWFEPLNAGCVAGEYITSSTLGDRTLAPVMEAIAEECVLGIALLDARGPAAREPLSAR